MDNPVLAVIQLLSPINGLSQNVEKTSQSLFPYRNRNTGAGIETNVLVKSAIPYPIIS